MTLLEPERLMMAVQSGNSVFPADSILPQVSLIRLGMSVLGSDRDGRKIDGSKHTVSSDCTACSYFCCKK